MLYNVGSLRMECGVGLMGLKVEVEGLVVAINRIVTTVLGSPNSDSGLSEE
jgi:hypothetical protein